MALDGDGEGGGGVLFVEVLFFALKALEGVIANEAGRTA